MATNGSLAGFALNPQRLFGDFLVLLTGMAWAIYSTLVKTLLERYPAITVLAYTTFAGTLFLLPLSLAELPVNFAAVTLSGWLNIIYLGLFASAMASDLEPRPRTGPGSNRCRVHLPDPRVDRGEVTFYYRQLPSLYTVAGGLIVLSGTYLTAKQRPVHGSPKIRP